MGIITPGPTFHGHLFAYYSVISFHNRSLGGPDLLMKQEIYYGQAQSLTPPGALIRSSGAVPHSLLAEPRQRYDAVIHLGKVEFDF